MVQKNPTKSQLQKSSRLLHKTICFLSQTAITFVYQSGQEVSESAWKNLDFAQSYYTVSSSFSAYSYILINKILQELINIEIGMNAFIDIDLELFQ